MANIRGLDDFPPGYYDDAPLAVRQAAQRHGRAVHAIRVYKKRGWNDAAVRLQARRAFADLTAALDEWEHDELNPRLF